ncbi:hypothetical protein Emtol_2074 [Emticicia oligotrophica DSM 17448]|uniref:Capsule assembly protein Wzi n=1 Tax=Emticicia oligotrophica (strain DSM 17448 / CIP 109782 / MTCC 6937 / GPTSA100-15) TaxID=929562 RepID=A0ABN4ALS0_EMTOG|nr:capsule assembly Wzi family protein [Emticicia oligotrophica]AFK03213.1 hypothetical protein Emtol_2074 [Emticicia oligotrophica DSM 17448]
MIRKFHIYVLIINISAINSFAQNFFSRNKYHLEVGTYLSTSGTTPFWLRSKQYGIVPFESNFFTVRSSTHKEYDSTTILKKNKLKKFDYGYGLGAVINAGKKSNFLLQEAYLKVRFGAFEFYAGRRKELVGLADTMLSSGPYVWSGNALPIPKIQISIPNYTSIVGHGLISIKGSFAHGWFGNQGETNDFFLHQKTLYGRIGKPNWRIKLYGGFNHQVQWGGKPNKPYIEPQTEKLITSYGNDFNTYLNVITGISLNNEGGTDIKGVPINDAWNRTGNHLGSIDIGMEIELPQSTIFIYRQSIYDDGSLYYLSNINDGILGLSIKTKNKTGLIGLNIEYLNTTNQGGDLSSESTIPELRGRDNYFNNTLYNWTYKNNTIGTPFMLPFYTIPVNNFANYSDLTKFYLPSFILNNKVRGVITGVKYNISRYSLTTKASFTKNYGIFGTPLLKTKQFSILQSSQFMYQKYFFTFNISYDSNTVLNGSLGTQLSLSRFF